MFWLFAAALTLTVALAILMPFWRARPDGAEPAAAYDLRVYRDQLAEIDRDLARGIIVTQVLPQSMGYAVVKEITGRDVPKVDKPRMGFLP